MQALRVIKSVCNSASRGNCRGGPQVSASTDELSDPLPKRSRTCSSGKHSMINCINNRVLFSLETSASCGQSTTLSGISGAPMTLSGGPNYICKH